jgi:hypothetical protein
MPDVLQPVPTLPMWEAERHRGFCPPHRHEHDSREAEMRWIDIPLPAPGRCQAFDNLLRQAGARAATLDALQEREGLDGLLVTRAMAEIGHLLFDAVRSSDPAAFQPDPHRRGAAAPPVDGEEDEGGVGYHIMAHPDQISLPWIWLHNGLGFVLERHPICAGIGGSEVPAATPPRPWMQRCDGARHGGEAQPAPPEILFVPGHGDEHIRRLIYREAEGISNVLRRPVLAPADLRVPRSAITPQQLAALSFTFQAIHYAGPTSRPTDSAVTDVAWLVELEANADPGSDAETDAAVEDLVGLEPDLVGVDPVDALLDTVMERYEKNEPPPETVGAGTRENSAYLADEGGADSHRGAAGRAGLGPAGTSGTGATTGSWLLDDGPVRPEILGRLGSAPPLIFSNSFRSLPELGRRFLAAGASTFVGPLAPVYSRPARRFAACFYDQLAAGLCAGSALRAAALTVREELGPDHPAWLSYGIVGYGTLALQYL